VTTRTEYLAGADQMDVNLVMTLQGWIHNEAINLSHFIADPVNHVNYNEYVIFDFDKLNVRLSMLQTVDANLDAIVKFKQQDPNTSQSMYESSLDAIPSIIFGRLLDWVSFKYVQLMKIIEENGDPNNISPIQDYVGMFTFNQAKFMQDFNMFVNTMQGCQAVVNYKVEMGV
jgi:hypothetical protein